jgi:hypothetical protein
VANDGVGGHGGKRQRRGKASKSSLCFFALQLQTSSSRSNGKNVGMLMLYRTLEE